MIWKWPLLQPASVSCSAIVRVPHVCHYHSPSSHLSHHASLIFMLIRRFAAAALTSVVAPRWATSFISSEGTCRCSSQPPFPSLFSRGRQTTAVAIRPTTTSVMSATPAASAVWDAAAGVWVGDKAAGLEENIPSPLWIFG